MKIKIHQPQGIHEIGGRSNQEDCIYPPLGQATATSRLFVVCDGMGGHAHGEVASRTVCQAIGESLGGDLAIDAPLDDSRLAAALGYAYQCLDDADEGDVRQMGTTLTLLALHRGGATAAHIGDSRIYHIRPAERRIMYRSRDHSLVMELFQVGEITMRDMATSPQRNVITRAMQPGADNRALPDVVHITDIKAGDCFVLCSDGITERMPTDEQLLDIVCSDASDEDKRQRLLDATSANRDNHSAYLIHIADVEAEPQDADWVGDETRVRFNLVNMVPALAFGGEVASRYGGSRGGYARIARTAGGGQAVEDIDDMPDRQTDNR